MRFGRLKTSGVAAAILTALITAPAPATAGPAHNGTSRIEYTLGDTAFSVPGFLDEEREKEAKIELTAVVHAPQSSQGPRPVVMLAHGLWTTCGDDASLGWPCPAGVPPVRSYAGYDYLAKDLAEQGFVVVSVGANGINAGELGTPADMARAALVNKHLEMLRDANDGKGPLAGQLRALRGKLDLTNVGLMGHSRGGRGAVWQAADIHASDLPRGVRLRAVVPLAPADYHVSDPDSPEHLNYRITKIPFAVLAGDCDGGAVMNRRSYAKNAAGRNEAPFYEVDLAGANHNFFNSEWAYDNDTSCAPQDTWDPARVQDAASRYIVSFFRFHMLGDQSVKDTVLNGFPGARVTTHRPVSN
ncbi:alpha/beta hydrolase family protein [Streptomyces zingiberis]|uniref:Alpha/beta hydrolase n=1 Tax=Streptomyces zingiberis TaxID=2053010 RepID=A0ABX1BS23_9ACTN|nr:hypothetical protein [Streptomyces zingiberis]NJP99857.1 hypothetical protein [Streptomyces zingiberis]